MPAAFAAHSGSLLMLIGSPVTVVVADYAESTGAGRLGLFSTGLIGLVLTVATIGVVLLLGSRLVPQRSSGKVLRDLGAHGALLAEHYGLDEPQDKLMQRGRGTAEFIIPPRSRFIGDLVHHGMVTESGELCCSGGPGRRWPMPPMIPTSSRSTTRTRCAGRQFLSAGAPSAPSASWLP